MGCNEALARFTFDSATVEAVAALGTIQYSSGTKNSKCITENAGNITLNRKGDYKVTVNVTTIATAAGVEEIQLYRNGTAVPGAHALETAAAVGDATSMSFSTFITVDCCGGLQLSVRSTPATSVRIANITIEQI